MALSGILSHFQSGHVHISEVVAWHFIASQIRLMRYRACQPCCMRRQLNRIFSWKPACPVSVNDRRFRPRFPESEQNPSVHVGLNEYYEEC